MHKVMLMGGERESEGECVCVNSVQKAKCRVWYAGISEMSED